MEILNNLSEGDIWRYLNGIFTAVLFSLGALGIVFGVLTLPGGQKGFPCGDGVRGRKTFPVLCLVLGAACFVAAVFLSAWHFHLDMVKIYSDMRR